MSMYYTEAGSATWGTVCTARETPELLAAFAAHHAAIGASKVYLYLDEPSPRALELLAVIPAVDVTVCDQAYWARVNNGRPRSQEGRQIVNAQDALRRAEVDWLLHIDADEFLSPQRDLSLELSQVPSGIEYLHLEMRERAFVGNRSPETIFDGAFRVPIGQEQRVLRLIYGPGFGFTNGGFAGQTAGKSLVRVKDCDLLMGIHRPRVPSAQARERPMGLACQSAVLLHFEGLTPAHWMAKITRYSQTARYSQGDLLGRHQKRQVNYLIRNNWSAEALRKLHDLLKVIDEPTETRLRGLGVLETSAVNPSYGLRVFGLGAEVDLSVECSDRGWVDWAPGILSYAA